MTSITEILQKLKDNYQLIVTIQDLGNNNNYKVLGKTILSKNIIYFDPIIIDNLSLLHFTVAHEMGHWKLHRDRPIIFDKNELNELEDYEINFSKKKKLKTPIDWIEHQANIFAASILMPRETFIKGLIEVQKHLGITHRLGTIYLNNESYSKNDLNSIVFGLEGIFGTSKTSIIIRLDQLNLLINEKTEKVMRINDIMSNLF